MSLDKAWIDINKERPNKITNSATGVTMVDIIVYNTRFDYNIRYTDVTFDKQNNYFYSDIYKKSFPSDDCKVTHWMYAPSFKRN